MKLIISGKVFDEVISHVHSIEFQNRGLPHAHILLILKNKINDALTIDKFVSAEIRNVKTENSLFLKVIEHIIRETCGTTNHQSPCMENGICTK